MRAGILAWAMMFNTGLWASAVHAQGSAAAPRAAEVRELAHAILVARAAERRVVEEQIKPTVEAVNALREALRLYLSEYEVRATLPTLKDPGAPAAAAPADPSVEASAKAERRVARQQAAREALQHLRASRETLVAERLRYVPSARNAAAGGATEDAPEGVGARVRPDVVEALEADVESALDVRPEESQDEGQKITQLRALLERLEVPSSRPMYREGRPTFVFREPGVSPAAPEGR